MIEHLSLFFDKLVLGLTFVCHFKRERVWIVVEVRFEDLGF
jgi:hypothetical protein